MTSHVIPNGKRYAELYTSPVAMSHNIDFLEYDNHFKQWFPTTDFVFKPDKAYKEIIDPNIRYGQCKECG